VNSLLYHKESLADDQTTEILCFSCVKVILLLLIECHFMNHISAYGQVDNSLSCNNLKKI
ncbi:MAG: hypothetical protein MJK18_10645, partial [Bdellovibrionales bacterium]|nr:hypothetical protein [Bdellovibrionales bacterium]